MISKSLENSLKFPDIFKATNNNPTLIVDENDNKIGYKYDREIYLDFNTDKETTDKIMTQLIEVLRKKKAKGIPDPNRPDRIGFLTVDGYSVFFTVDYITYKYIYVNHILKALNKVSEYGKDLHIGTLFYKFREGIYTEEDLDRAYEEMWREATK